MKDRVSFQLKDTSQENTIQLKEVMNVDLVQWEAFKEVIVKKYDPLLRYLREDFPIQLNQQSFLETEKEMRQIQREDLNEDAYVAHFSLDIFIRQLDDLSDEDVVFDLI